MQADGAELLEVGEGNFAYLQRDGSWGWSNAGLVTSRGDALLVDTLYDLNLTRRMLDTMRRRTAGAANIETVVNTHANGDHCWGNQLVAGAEIVASRRAAKEMRELTPALMKTSSCERPASRVGLGQGARRATNLLGRIGLARPESFGDAAQFVVDKFGAFDFEGIELCPPTTTFDGSLTVTVGDKDVHLVEVGPTHTRGDVIVHVPADRIVFSGDILFIGSHPIVWDGPVSNWIRACDRPMLELDRRDLIVPGHGPPHRQGRRTADQVSTGSTSRRRRRARFVPRGCRRGRGRARHRARRVRALARPRARRGERRHDLPRALGRSNEARSAGLARPHGAAIPWRESRRRASVSARGGVRASVRAQAIGEPPRQHRRDPHHLAPCVLTPTGLGKRLASMM